MVGTVIATMRVTTRGRITIPKMVNLRAGDQLDYKRQPDGSYRIRKVKQRIPRAK
jgi:AbrB family looped-hinge helix DNA binding protein